MAIRLFYFRDFSLFFFVFRVWRHRKSTREGTRGTPLASLLLLPTALLASAAALSALDWPIIRDDSVKPGGDGSTVER